MDSGGRRPCATLGRWSRSSRRGSTSLVRLRRCAPRNGAELRLKLEYYNPTGSMKDRMALAMIEGAERDGLLSPGATVVEYTGGSTGPSLALVCVAKGYRALIVMADCFTRERFQLLRALGAKVDVVPSVAGPPIADTLHRLDDRALARLIGPDQGDQLAVEIDVGPLLEAAIAGDLNPDQAHPDRRGCFQSRPACTSTSPPARRHWALDWALSAIYGALPFVPMFRRRARPRPFAGLFAMARPGLEPGTPRFSDVRPCF
jgi:hypothetical protein